MVLTLAMGKVQAWERLCDRDYSGRLTMEEFHRLLIDAGYDEDNAWEAACERGWNRLEAGVEM